MCFFIFFVILIVIYDIGSDFMGTGMFFPICALPFSFIILILFNKKKHIDSKETRIFNTLIISNFIGLIVEISCTYASKLYFDYSIISNIVYKGYLFYLLLWISTITYYVYSITRNDNTIKSNRIKIFFIYYFAVAVILLLLPIKLITKDNFSIRYTTGLSVYFTYVISIIAIVIIIITLLTNIKKINNKKYVPIVLFLIIGGIATFIQSIYPQFLLMTYVETLICVIMYFTIENPDVKMIEELELAKNQAEKANHAKTDFLSSMSHEIRTPLNAIVGFSECVLSSNTLEEAKENSADIINASKTLLEIVNGILDISKIESGKLEIINSSYKAKALLESVATLVRPRMEEKGLDFQISISEDIPEVLYGDHSNLKKIITNLLSNASKYTEHGFVKYSVSCINNNNICRLIITVEDSGRGIKEENISKLFTKFQRLDEDRNTTIEGTGLGLAITKKLLELMGGKIVVQSRYGEGSKFTAIVDQKIEIIKNLNIAPVEVVTKSKDVSGKKVLIVDDNTLNLKVASKLLEKYKLNIETVDSGLACIEKINGGSIYDMILMDDMMPKMSGVETLNELKKQSNFTTPVIALTANAISGMKEKYISCGFNDYLAKPINKTELETIVYKYLNTTGSTKTNINFGELPKEVYQIGSKGGLIVPDNPDNKENSNNLYITVDVSTDKEQILKDNDIDYQKGIELLGDISMYQETMKDFLNGINDRMSNLEKYQNDMNSYAIEVHALKSDAKYLGFTKLAEIAYDQELRSKENNQRYIISNYSQLKEEVSRVCDVCKKYLSTI